MAAVTAPPAALPPHVVVHAKTALAGSACAVLMHLILVPLDCIKTALQLAPAGTASGGFGATARALVARGGARALAAGTVPTVVGYTFQGAAKFGIFDAVSYQLRVRGTAGDAAGAHARPLSFLEYALAASVGECVGTALLAPFEAARIRQVQMAATGGARLGLPGTLAAIGAAAPPGKSAASTLWAGFVPLLSKQLPYTAVQLGAFSVLLQQAYSRVVPRALGMAEQPGGPAATAAAAKASLSKQQQVGVSVACGALAGAISSVASQPGDAVLTRVAALAAAGSPERGFAAAIRSLGPRGLVRGLGTRAVFTAILSAGMFLVLDTAKVALGLQTSG